MADSPLVGIVMGSANDWPKIKRVGEALREFEVPFEVQVMSAHRTPQVVAEYATSAARRGLRVIVAAAGGAAHLAGVVAAHTELPVIGLPVPTAELGGMDSLLSTVQMPGDVPVATVAVGMGGPRNAGILAVQILATADPQLRQRLVDFRRQLQQRLAQQNAQLQQMLRDESAQGAGG
jgi:5-(carboxyamino)imidazole ribonucleotide mutase